jgi:hypothetical protein
MRRSAATASEQNHRSALRLTVAELMLTSRTLALHPPGGVLAEPHRPDPRQGHGLGLQTDGSGQAEAIVATLLLKARETYQLTAALSPAARPEGS